MSTWIKFWDGLFGTWGLISFLDNFYLLILIFWPAGTLLGEDEGFENICRGKSSALVGAHPTWLSLNQRETSSQPSRAACTEPQVAGLISLLWACLTQCLCSLEELWGDWRGQIHFPTCPSPLSASQVLLSPDPCTIQESHMIPQVTLRHMGLRHSHTSPRHTVITLPFRREPTAMPMPEEQLYGQQCEEKSMAFSQSSRTCMMTTLPTSSQVNFQREKRHYE